MIKLFDKEMNEIVLDNDTYKIKVYPLENFAPYGLTLNKMFFPTSEHAFQYLKFVSTDDAIAEKIMEAKTPEEARRIAHEYKKRRASNWKKIKYDVMEEVIEMKVNQNDEVREALLNTRDLLIAEFCVDEDTDWGIDKNNKGENHLGKALMKVRKNINK